MKVQIIDVNVVNKGKYSQAEVTYKNLTKGAVESKNIMSFLNKEVYNTVVNANKGDQFDVTLAKNDKGYWEWTGIGKDDGTTPEASPAPQGRSPSAATASPKSTYETAEERAKRQVLIVRQSSLSNAIEVLKTDKKNPTKEEVVDLADYFYDWVFDNKVKTVKLADLPPTDDFEDDVPV